MSSFIRAEQCPRCAERGADRAKDNLGVYSDGSAHCFSCGFHRFAKFTPYTQKEKISDQEKAVLPADFTKEIPAAGWRWLLQYGLPYSYWETHCGYSPRDGRLIFTIGKPTKFSIGRQIEDRVGTSKWRVYGDKSSHVEIVSEQLSENVVLVEDIISAHKVGTVMSSIPLFGTAIHDIHLKALKRFNRPVVLWLDSDQYTLLGRKIGRLQALLGLPVRAIRTEKDPKSYSTLEIEEILK